MHPTTVLGIQKKPSLGRLKTQILATISHINNIGKKGTTYERVLSYLNKKGSNQLG